nr:hypothetical protein [Tanacetum cinerariifolium]
MLEEMIGISLDSTLDKQHKISEGTMHDRMGLPIRMKLVILLLQGLRVLEIGIKPGDLDEIEEVNANCILMENLQYASTSGTQHDKAPVYDTDGLAKKEQYTDLPEPIPEPQLVPQNDNHVTSVTPSIVQSGGTIETSSAPNEETHAHQETVYLMEFPLEEEVPTASEESSRCQKKRDTTAEKIVLLLKSSSNCQSKSYDSYAKDSYEVPASAATTCTASDGTSKKKGRTVIVTANDMQKKKNDVKARTTSLLSLLDEHQLRFSKYKTAQKLWAVILKTFGGNETTKKTKKNLLKQQYGNFKAEGSETLEQTFNRLQVIVSQLQFMDVEIKQDDLNQKFLTSLAPEWLMHTIVWRNISDLDTISLDDLYNHIKVYESKVQKKSKINSQNMAFISSAKHIKGNEEVNTASASTTSTNVPTASANIGVVTISQDTTCAYITSQSSGSQIKFEDINQIDEDDMEEMDIKWNMALLSMRADRFWKKTGKKISIQGTYVARFDKLKVECFNCHKMGHFARECRAPRSQDRGRRDNYRQGSKVVEQFLKALMAIDGARWDWSYMANDEENHALVTDKEAPIEFTLMAKTSAESKDMSWTGLPEFKDDTVTDYSRPAPTVESSPDDAQNKNPSVTETEASPSTISPKSFIKFVKANDSLTNSKTDKAEIAKKPSVKKFPTGGTKFSTVDMGKKGKAVKPSACWFWKPSQNLSNKGLNSNSVSVMLKKYTYIDTQGRLNGYSRHMTGNISYLSDYEPFNGGFVSFGQGGCKITGKVTIKIECIVLGRNFKLSDDDNVLLRTPRQHNMYLIDLNDIVPHKDLTCLVAKASADECMSWHMRL